MTTEELAQEISRFVNGASDDKLQELAEHMLKDHRTLQQKKMKLACMFIELMAENKGVDARNEHSQKTAEHMIEGYRKACKQDVINQDGDISEAMDFFLDLAMPSKGLPTI